MHFFLLNSMKCCDIRRKKLLVFLFDGFRHDYEKLHKLENFEKLRSKGVFGALIPVFPSMSAPNYYSPLTGKYPEDNGMVSNKMWDPPRNKTFRGFSKEGNERYQSYWWNETEPFWITAMKQGLRVKMWDWLGYNVNFNGVKPDCCSDFRDIIYHNDSGIESFVVNLNAALGNFSHDLLDVALIYLPDADDIGHKYGPDSHQLIDRVKDIDKRVIGYLDKKLDKIQYKDTECKLKDVVNTAIFSDHGMTSINMKCIVDLEDILNNKTLVRKFLKSSTLYHIWPQENYETEVAQKLRAVRNITVFEKSTAPKRYHYANNDRIGPIVATIDLQCCFKNKDGKNNETVCEKGNHGFDPYVKGNEQMLGIFYSFGPSIRKKITVKPFQNVEIYQLLCSLTNLNCVQTSSNLLTQILNEKSLYNSPVLLILFITIGVILCLVALGVFGYNIYRKTGKEYVTVNTEDSYGLS